MKVVSPGAFIDYLLLGCTDKQQRPRVERYLLHRGWLDSAQHDESQKPSATTTLVWSDLSNRVLEYFGFAWESIGPEMLSQLVSTVNGFPCAPLGIQKKRRQRSPTPTSLMNSAPISILSTRKRQPSPLKQSGVSPLLGGLIRRSIIDGGMFSSQGTMNMNSTGSFIPIPASPRFQQPSVFSCSLGNVPMGEPMHTTSTEVPILRQSARLQPGSLRIGSFTQAGK
eukprot:TRINITY_DN7255_c0_g2_i1.p1 TRINITY_DN7255_c0_g2~~TRINITY_DN7255_c0_g2_i1.p1  ORF type:complete len:225 (-),score=61.04 TRINITY_DN7255_c0_g2_i1:97-771(-)